ncbi:MAG: Na+/H+ antiporter NhaA, partial [Ketobacter sp.]
MQLNLSLAGIALAFFIPIRDNVRVRSPLHELEHDLHTAVAYAILPLFA